MLRHYLFLFCILASLVWYRVAFLGFVMTLALMPGGVGVGTGLLLLLGGGFRSVTDWTTQQTFETLGRSEETANLN